MFRLSSTSYLIAIAAVVGCGNTTIETGPTLVPVSGTLTLDGQPLPFKSLRLAPTGGTAGRGAAGYSDPEGRFELKAVISDKLEDIAGCPPGHYRVIVNEPLVPITETDFDSASHTSAEQSSGPAVAILLPDPNAKSNIPAVYSSESTSPLEIEICGENQTLAVELQSQDSKSSNPTETSTSDNSLQKSTD